MTLIYVLLALGFTSLAIAFLAFCVMRVGDGTNWTPVSRPTLDPLAVYLMEREHKHQADPAFNQLAEEEQWRTPLNLERYRRQFDACLGKVPRQPKPLTGIEKHFLDPQWELDWIGEEYHKHFGTKAEE